MDEQRPLRTKLAGNRRFHQLARITAAHLKQDAELKLLERSAFEGPHQVGQRVAPDDRVDTHGGAILEDVDEVLGRPQLLLTPEGEAEVALALAELPEPSKVANDHEDRIAIQHLLVEPPLHLPSNPLDRIANTEATDTFQAVRQQIRKLGEHRLWMLLSNRWLKQHKAGRPAEATAGEGIVARRQPHHRHRQQARRQILPLADNQQVGATLPAEGSGGRILDRDRIPQPGHGHSEFLGIERAALGRAFAEKVA